MQGGRSGNNLKVSFTALKKKIRLFRCSRFLLLLGCLSMLSVSAGASSYPIRYHNDQGLRRLAMRDVAAFYGLRQSMREGHVYWRGAGGSAEFEVDRRRAKVNGTRMHLSHSVGEHEGQATLGEADFRLLIDPLLRDAALPPQSVRTIVIDPGHGGRDEGTRGSRYTEKEVVLAISRHLAWILRQRGFQVHLTRTLDEFIPLRRRAEMAREAGADIFVSVHANSAADSSVRGFETFILPPAGTPGTYTNRAVNVKRPGNDFDKQNLRLAYEIQRRSVVRTGTVDRGVKHALMEVLRPLSCPGVLVEVGFMSNRREERKLGDTDYQRQVAHGIAEGIIAYSRIVSR